MVKTNALKLMWKDKCTIKVTDRIIDDDGISSIGWVTLVEDEPCKLSFFNNTNKNGSGTGVENATALFQQTKLFIRPDLDIPEGSRITVITHENEKTLYYEASGIPQIFTNHQEILVEAVKKWA